MPRCIFNILSLHWFSIRFSPGCSALFYVWEIESALESGVPLPNAVWPAAAKRQPCARSARRSSEAAAPQGHSFNLIYLNLKMGRSARQGPQSQGYASLTRGFET